MSRTRILIVEDEPIVSRDIRDTIISFGYDVAATASSGEEAVKKAAEWTPDLVLMDIVLNVLVVYMSAHSEMEILDRAKLTCPYGYVMKPFTERELAMAIEVTLARRIEPPTCS